MTELSSLNAIFDRRFSCRGFLNTPVERSVIAQIIQTAQKVPSWCNSQPWQVHLLSPQKRDHLSARLMDAALAGQEIPDIAFPQRYSGAYKHRRSVCGWQLYDAVGVEKGDRDGSRRQMLENYRFFGAPHVAVISTPRELGPYGVLDCGAFVTAFSLAATAAGVATIPQAAIAGMSPIVRKVINLADDRDVLCAISFGYVDTDHPANQFRTNRADLDEVLIDVD
jgi:nitroreductase